MKPLKLLLNELFSGQNINYRTEHMKISNDVANVLANSTVEGCLLFLPDEQLERKLYMAVNKVLTALKGKWNRAKKAHVFDYDVSEAIEQVLQTGEYTDAKKEFQFFETPIHLAEMLVSMAAIEPEMTVREPSAGKGRIITAIKANCPDTYISAIELNPENVDYLKNNLSANFDKIEQGDFLKTDDRFDVFIANPPFSKQQDIDHVNHMLDLANVRVVSVMSASVMYRTNKKTVEFRERINDLGGTIKMLPDNTFSESGTNVNTCVVSVDV